MSWKNTSPLKPWSGPFFRTKSDDLERELSQVFERKSLFDFLDDNLDSNHGLYIADLSFKPPIGPRVIVQYGLRSYNGKTNLFFIKDNAVIHPYDFTIITTPSFFKVEADFLPEKTYPSSHSFINAVNNALKRPEPRKTYLVPKRVL